MAKKDRDAADDSPRAAKFMSENAEDVVKRSPGETEEVPIEPEKDDDEDETPQAPETDVATEPTRLDKKRARYREQLSAKDAEIQELKRQNEMSKLRQEFIERQAAGVQAVLQQGPQPKSRHDTELEENQRQMQALVDGFQGRQRVLPQGKDLTAEEYAEYRKRFQEIQDKRYEIIAEKRGAHQQPGVTVQQVQVQARMAMIQQQYPDVTQHPTYAQYFGTEYQANRALGQEENAALASAAEATRVKFRLKQASKAPSQVEKSRYTGLGGGNAGPSQAARSIPMTPDMKKLAEARYKKLALKDPRLAHREWAKRYGPGVLEDERSQGR